MQRSKRDRLATTLDRVGLLEAMLYLRRRLPPTAATVLTYHRVDTLDEDYPFDRGTVEADPWTFDQQMELVSRYSTPITLGQLAAFLSDGVTLPPNPVLVTFDDGYRDNLEQAVPILRAHNIPAVFFIATTYVEQRRMFWWDQISYLLARTRCSELRINYPVPLYFRLPEERIGAARTLQRLVKEYYDLDLKRLLAELAGQLQVRWDRELETRLADEMLMTWDDIRELRAQGMEVQSHTRTHRVLHTLRAELLASELAGARRDLEKQLDAPVWALSYPVGYSVAALPRVQQALREAGYRLGFTNNGRGIALWRTRDPFDLERVAMGDNVTSATFRGLLALPRAGFVL